MTTLDVVDGKVAANREKSEKFLTYIGGWKFDRHHFNPDHVWRISPIPECLLFFNPLKVVFEMPENAALAQLARALLS